MPTRKVLMWIVVGWLLSLLINPRMLLGMFSRGNSGG